MKLSKERAVYAVVLGVGLLALIADRALFSPASASAAPEDYAAPRDEAPEALAPAPDLPADAAANNSLAHRLRTDNPEWQSSIRNGFRADEEWIAPPQLGAAPQAPTDPATDFAAAHALTAIQSNSAVTGAIVNGRFYRLGEEADGWTLAEVTSTAAIFTRGDHRAKLAMDQPHVASEVSSVTVREAGSTKPASPPEKP